MQSSGSPGDLGVSCRHGPYLLSLDCWQEHTRIAGIRDALRLHKVRRFILRSILLGERCLRVVMDRCVFFAGSGCDGRGTSIEAVTLLNLLGMSTRSAAQLGQMRRVAAVWHELDRVTVFVVSLANIHGSITVVRHALRVHGVATHRLFAPHLFFRAVSLI